MRHEADQLQAKFILARKLSSRAQEVSSESSFRQAAQNFDSVVSLDVQTMQGKSCLTLCLFGCQTSDDTMAPEPYRATELSGTLDATDGSAEVCDLCRTEQCARRGPIVYGFRHGRVGGC